MFSESSIVLIQKCVIFLRLLGPFPYIWNKGWNTLDVTSSRRRFTQLFILHYPMYFLYTLYQLQIEWGKPNSDTMTLFWLVIFVTGHILCGNSVFNCTTNGKEQVQFFQLLTTFEKLPQGSTKLNYNLLILLIYPF